MFDKKPKALCLTGIGEANDEDYVTVVIIPDTPEIVDSISVTSFHCLRLSGVLVPEIVSSIHWSI